MDRVLFASSVSVVLRVGHPVRICGANLKAGALITKETRQEEEEEGGDSLQARKNIKHFEQNSGHIERRCYACCCMCVCVCTAPPPPLCFLSKTLRADGAAPCKLLHVEKLLAPPPITYRHSCFWPSHWSTGSLHVFLHSIYF